MIPLAVWLSEIDSQVKLKESVESEIELTHSNKAVQELCYIYAVAVQSLIKNWQDPDRSQMAFYAAFEASKT